MMNSNTKIWLSGFAGGAAVVLALSIGSFYVQYGTLPFVGDSVVTGETGEKAAKIERIIENNYLEDVDEETLAEGMYAGMMASLGDKYSGYYSEDDYKKLKESSEGKYTGIGLVMEQNRETGKITVAQSYVGSPAAEAGIQAGDEIYKIGEQLAAELNVTDISNQIRNGGTKEIELTIKREGLEEPFTVTIVPDTVEIPVVSSRMLENSVGYLHIAEFTDGTSEQFRTAYQELQDEDMKGMIIDLRNNPGGLLDAVCDTLEQILPEGLIVYTEDKYGKREEHTCDGETPIEIPLVVLVNGESASAAEIFAGAVKDHGIAELVGTTTFGKGIVQKIYTLSDGSAVKLTVSKYYTPNGINIHGTGIEPDITVEWPEDQEELLSPSEVNELSFSEWIQKDNQMKKAWEEIISMVVEEEK
ncbi:MAG: S41 family peptidase [Oliverpabstia sp.]